MAGNPVHGLADLIPALLAGAEGAEQRDVVPARPQRAERFGVTQDHRRFGGLLPRQHVRERRPVAGSHNIHERRGGATIVVDALLQKSRLKTGLDRAAAIDIVWVLTASDIFWRLVRAREWADAQYENWLGDTLCEQLLPPAERRSGP